MRPGRDLDTLLGYIVQRVELTMTEDARRALAPFGITPARLTALLLVRDNPGCDQTALGRALSINRSSAMKIVNLLVERGLVERRPGRDLRSNALHLTAKAEDDIAPMLAALRASDDHMTASLDPTERRTLSALLRKVGSNAAARAPDA